MKHYKNTLRSIHGKRICLIQKDFITRKQSISKRHQQIKIQICIKTKHQHSALLCQVDQALLPQPQHSLLNGAIRQKMTLKTKGMLIPLTIMPKLCIAFQQYPLCGHCYCIQIDIIYDFLCEILITQNSFDLMIGGLLFARVKQMLQKNPKCWKAGNYNHRK